MSEEYDFIRVFVDGLGSADDVERALVNTGHYRLDALTLVNDDVSIAVLRNKNTIVAGESAFLGWPVTMEVFREEEDKISDDTVRAVLRRLVGDIKAMGGQVVVAADFADEL
jgi:hypothetical protein